MVGQLIVFAIGPIVGIVLWLWAEAGYRYAVTQQPTRRPTRTIRRKRTVKRQEAVVAGLVIFMLAFAIIYGKPGPSLQNNNDQSTSISGQHNP